MWPWGHLAVGYLSFVAITRHTGRARSDPLAVTALVIGTQIPDLVDKPLAYWLAVLPEGRSLAHSLLVLVPLCALIIIGAERYRRSELGGAFALGALSHAVADGLFPLLGGRWEELTYLVWPLLPVPDYEAASFSHHGELLATALRELSLGQLLTGWQDAFIAELWLTLLVAIVWIADGMPPLGAGLRVIRAGR